jgi:hypothetical protein
MTAQLQYMRPQLQACRSEQQKDVTERMIKNLESALGIAKDVGKFVSQLADGGREEQTGLVEVLTERRQRC